MATLTRSRARKPLAEGDLRFSARSAPGTERPFVSFAVSIMEDTDKGWITHRLEFNANEAAQLRDTLNGWLTTGAD